VVAKSSYAVSGLEATASLGTAVVRDNARPTFDGLVATGNIGTVSVTTTIFDYNAVAALYDRSRAVLVERRSTAIERTAAVSFVDRKVYVERQTTSSERSSAVELLPRRAYMYRKTSSSDRSVLVA